MGGEIKREVQNNDTKRKLMKSTMRENKAEGKAEDRRRNEKRQVKILNESVLSIFWQVSRQQQAGDSLHTAVTQ